MAPDLEEVEAWWHDRPVEGVLPGCLPWLPYPLAQFCTLLTAAVEVTDGCTFLDVGCGVGTKCLTAASYGLLAAGLDIVPAYLAQAVLLHVPCFRADVRTWSDYDCWGIVYLNHPLVGDSEEALLERYVQDQMRPGQVLMSVNSMAPPREGWDVVTRLNVHDLVAVKCGSARSELSNLDVGGAVGGY